METSSEPVPRSATVNTPVSNVFITGGEYMRGWSSVKTLPDIDVFFLIFHDWTPDQMACFHRFMLTSTFALCVGLKRNNFQFVWDHVLNTLFVSLSPPQISDILAVVRDSLVKHYVTAQFHPIVLNGQTYSCAGGDEGSAKLLFSLLTLAVSEEQIQLLYQDICSSGSIAKIIFDPDFADKINSARDELSFIIRSLQQVFSIYMHDEVLSYAAAFLVVSDRIDDSYIALFNYKYDDEVRTIAMAELSVETSVVHSSAANEDTLENIYCPNGVYSRPWETIPGYSKHLEQELLKPSLQITNASAGLTTDAQLMCNSALRAMDNLNRSFILKPKELIGTSVIAACKDFTFDSVYIATQDLSNAVCKAASTRTDIYLIGGNRDSNFQHLAMTSSSRVLVCRPDPSDFFNIVSRDTKVVVYTDPQSYASSLKAVSATSIVLVDNADRYDHHTQRNCFRFDEIPVIGPSFGGVFKSIMELFSKPKSRPPDDHHALLPPFLALRFVPYISNDVKQVRDFMNALSHHYNVRFYVPVDFNGLAFTITFEKRVKMIPKKHAAPASIFELFIRFVYHTVAIRYRFLSGVYCNRYTWRSLGPLRAISRYWGGGGDARRFKVNGLVDFADWGTGRIINDVNNMFSGHMDADALKATKAVMGLTKLQKRMHKKGGTGVSMHHEKAATISNYFSSASPAMEARSERKVNTHPGTPKHKKERIQRDSNSFPVT